MERLTFDGLFCDIAMCSGTPGGSFCEEGACSQRRVWERLKAYEDTGLTPEDLRLGLNAAGRKKAGAEYYGLTGEELDRAVELLKANDEGRLVVLPCKVGDTVWLLKQKCKYAGDQNKPWDNCDQYWSNVRKKGMWGCAGKDSEGNTFPCEKKEMVWYAHEMEYSLILYTPHIVLGKNLFLTREEAEAALAKEGPHGS